MAYTYDDFTRAATAAGMMEQFDKDDLVTAQKYPEYGLSLLSLKNDLNKAGTEEQRLLINEAANQLKSSYSTRDTTPQQSGYVSPYEDKLDELMSKAEGQSSFSYELGNDPAYSAYRKEYLREAERARADTLAEAAAASGGIPSSYAVNAAAQAGDYYTGRLADVIPTLYNEAYSRHLNEYQRILDELGAYRDMDETEYARAQQEYENALRLYQLMGYDAPAEALARLGITVPTASGGDGYIYYGSGKDEDRIAKIAREAIEETNKKGIAVLEDIIKGVKDYKSNAGAGGTVEPTAQPVYTSRGQARDEWAEALRNDEISEQQYKLLVNKYLR